MTDADRWGIIPAYHDAYGTWRQVPDRTRRELVESMGGDPESEGPEPSASPHVIRIGEPLLVPGATALHLENGADAPVDRLAAGDVPAGYHRLSVAGEQDPRLLIVSPGTCWLPDDLRTWGWATQLYATRSRASWGIGDFADLRQLGAWSTSLGAGTLLVNPLNAVTPVVPRQSSPYFPTSRRFLDPLYLRIEEVPGADRLGDRLDAHAVDAREMNATRQIDRDAVWIAKSAALELVWEEVDGAGSEPEFLRYLEAGGEDLLHFATFNALAQRFGAGWRQWPDGYRRPDAHQVASFAVERSDQVRFHAWLQWLCERQLHAAGEQIGLLLDVPIGADPDGADAWLWQDVLASDVSVGAPPDALGPQGQDWGLPAFVPHKLQAAGYWPFIATVRAAMRHAGGVRIDHVLGLFRLFWIPRESSAVDGAYVRQPTRQLLDILALESHRNRAFVVGEDLGTVEPGVREELAARRILRYQVFWFEEDAVDRWPSDALASVTTHDLPTVGGVWTGEDARMQREIGLEPDDDWFRGLRDKICEQANVASDASAAKASAAVHGLLASAPNRVVVAQLEDALALAERPNVPGTMDDVRPNWSLALPVDLDDLPDDPTVRAVADAIRRERGNGHQAAATG